MHLNLTETVFKTYACLFNSASCGRLATFYILMFFKLLSIRYKLYSLRRLVDNFINAFEFD